MASYTQLRKLFDNPELNEKVFSATVIAAYNIGVDQTPPMAAIKTWARETLEDAPSAANNMMKPFIAANEALTETAILALDDAAIQTIVDNSVQALIGNG